MKFDRQFKEIFQLSQRVQSNTKKKKYLKTMSYFFPKYFFSKFLFHTEFPHLSFGSTGAYPAYWKISFCISSVLNGL